MSAQASPNYNERISVNDHLPTRDCAWIDGYNEKIDIQVDVMFDTFYEEFWDPHTLLPIKITHWRYYPYELD